MREILLEQPLTVGITGGALAALALVVWYQTRQKPILYAALGLVVLTIAAVSLSLQIETDRERIRSILTQTANNLETGDYEAVYAAIHPNAAENLLRAKRMLPTLKFEDARITTVKDISINHTTKPATAVAQFNIAAKIAAFGRVTQVRQFVKAYFMERDGKWLVRDIEYFEPTAGFRHTPLSNPQ